jgi:hypothetical protein
MTKYVAFDRFIVWLESLNRTTHVARFVRALRHRLHSIDEELADHVKDKFA